MVKRLFAVLCVLMLALGSLAITATAQTQDDTLKAGYATVDINPYWSTYSGAIKPSTLKGTDIMPLPMAGYGDNAHRLSAPALIDANGDGKISGPDGDGLHATCLAIQSGGRTVLIITVDLINFKSATTKLVRARITEATGIPGTNIMINGTHTHGGVDLSVSFSKEGEPYLSEDGKTTYTAEECTAYLEHYTNFLVDQLTACSVQAVADLTVATMEKGTIDAGVENDGKTMNGVRHYVQKHAEATGPVTYVRGSSFNNNIEYDDKYDNYYNYGHAEGGHILYGATHISESNDALHLLRFKVSGKDDILLVNWRGHPASSNKSYKNANGKSVNIYQNLYSDYIGAIRYNLDSSGYRTTFILGASGNLGANSALDWEDWVNEIAQSKGVPFAVEYGRIVAQTAKNLLNKTKSTSSGDPMYAIESGPVLTAQLKYKAKIQIPSALEVAACKAYQANADSIRSFDSYFYTDPITGEKFVVASSYHANAVVNRSIYKEGNTRSLELNVITVGNELSFIAMPYEASDRYSMEATMTTANNYNDWDLLEQIGSFGAPFVMTCANDHIGYIPNHLAYNYNKDSVHYGKYAAGSYESQISIATDGEGEKIIRVYADMLEQMQTNVEYCQACKKTVTWEPFTSALLSSNGDSAPSGHYYLVKDLTYTNSQVSLKSGNTLCLDLNGNTYAVAHPKNASRAINMSGGATLNIQDSSKEQTGKIMGRGVLIETAPDGFTCGTLNVGAGCTANLYSGTLTQDTTEGYHATNSGVMKVAGTFNMYGGTVTGGVSSSDYGGNINIDGGVFNMYGGTVSNGHAATYGGNIYVGGTGKFNMYGGKIIGGTAGTSGPSVYVCYSKSNEHSVQLTGTTDGNEPVQISFQKAVGNMLQINGTYTGKLEIRSPGSVVEGMNVAKCGENANIGGATITVVGMGDLSPVINGEYIKLSKRLGWMQLSGIWYYFYDVNKAQTGWFQDEGDWHYFDENGAMQLGWLEQGDARYFLDKNGHRVTGIAVADGTLCQFDENGLWQNVITGWNTLDGKKYYADENGVLSAGFTVIAGKTYYFGEDYAMHIGWLELDGNKYYLREDGTLATGWLNLSGVWYYLDATGAAACSDRFIDGALNRFDENGVWLGYANGWYQLNGIWYYTNAQGKPYTGWKSIGGVYYFFDSNGLMKTGWLQSGKTWYYLKSSGAMATGWAQVDGFWYYFDASGTMKTGWVKVGSTWYYMRSSGVMATGWVQDGSAWYYMKADGTMATGWVQEGSIWYYMKPDGTMATGTITIGGKQHKFTSAGVWQGEVQSQQSGKNGWVKESGLWYYYKNGTKKTGWLQDGGKWYYLKADGSMQIGWLKIGSAWYYMDASGIMVTGSKTIGSKTYNFDANGVCLNP